MGLDKLKSTIGTGPQTLLLSTALLSAGAHAEGTSSEVSTLIQSTVPATDFCELYGRDPQCNPILIEKEGSAVKQVISIGGVDYPLEGSDQIKAAIEALLNQSIPGYSGRSSVASN